MRTLLGAALACTILAILVGVAVGSNVGTFMAILLGGTAFVLLICAGFYAVGQSEDRERARSQPPDGDDRPPTAATGQPRAAARAPRRRSRGDRSN